LGVATIFFFAFGMFDGCFCIPVSLKCKTISKIFLQCIYQIWNYICSQPHHTPQRIYSQHN